MKPKLLLLITLLILVLVACSTKSTCPPDTVEYLTPPFPTEETNQAALPKTIQIGRQEIIVDEIISGDVCNDSWDGTIYVTCDIQIPPWEGEEALFLKDCDLKIAEGSVIYVEAHRNQPYYQGCSCHE